mmetsp:Transcript_12808/g.39863  ORF Transcript_12808/g.39863 Transcript_12808/m.39863 type:complete len:200 (+) Transcript_12808:272-871(+)
MSVAPHELGERSYDRDSGSCRRDCGTVTTSTPSSQRAKILRTSRRPDGSSQAQWYVSSRADMPAARLPRPVPTVDVELSCTPALRHAASAASAGEAVTVQRVALTCSTRLPPGKPCTSTLTSRDWTHGSSTVRMRLPRSPLRTRAMPKTGRRLLSSLPRVSSAAGAWHCRVGGASLATDTSLASVERAPCPPSPPMAPS